MWNCCWQEETYIEMMNISLSSYPCSKGDWELPLFAVLWTTMLVLDEIERFLGK